MVRELASEFAALSLHCFTDDQQSLERVVTDRLNVMTEDVGGMIRQWTLNSALSQLRVFVSSLSVSEDQIRDQVVNMEQGRGIRRTIQDRAADFAAAQTQNEATEPPHTAAVPPTRAPEPEAMEVTETQPPAPTVLTEIPPPGQEAALPAPLLSVSALSSPAASSPELGSLPASWLPIISR